MLYIEVMLNGKTLPVGGSQDCDQLTFMLIASKDGFLPQLSLHGMQNIAADKTEFIEWIREEVGCKDQVRLTLLETAIPGAPISKSIERNQSFATLTNRNQKVIPTDSTSQLPSKCPQFAYEIVMSNSISLRAEIEEEDVLQLILTWYRKNNECVFNVDSITAAENGYTKGRHWIEGNLKAGDWMEITVDR